MPGGPPNTIPPNNNTYGGSYVSNGSSYGNSYIGNYSNLPSGISNAGGGNNNAYVGAVQDNSLVQNQLQGLLSSNSPYIQQARLSGTNQANARGMLNSSIAAGNAQQAAINAALPIAQQDASTYSQQQLANQQSLNQILQERMGNDTQRDVANASYATQAAIAAANNQAALARQRENLAYSGEQAGLNRSFEEYMNQLGYRNQMGLNQQSYQYGLGQSAFNLAGNLMQNNSNFRNQAGLQAMNNPFLLQNPQAFGGYMDWIGNGYSSSISDLLAYAFGGGY